MVKMMTVTAMMELLVMVVGMVTALMLMVRPGVVWLEKLID